MQIIRAADLVATPWRNGMGTTRDVATLLAPDGTLRWQVSIADLVQDAPFSHYGAADRIFTPIAGDPPPELAFNGGPFEPCPLLVPKPFPGDVPTQSRIPAPGRAFNVITARAHWSAEVTVLTLAEGHTAAAPILYCHTGRLTHGAGTLTPGDTLLAPDDPATATEPTVLIAVTLTQNPFPPP